MKNDLFSAKLAKMPLPCRNYALAKAEFEAAEAANFREQKEAASAATADDPEPDSDHDPVAWNEWYDRNQAMIFAITDPIVGRYPHELKLLAEQAERGMVEFAMEVINSRWPKRRSQVAPLFEKYRDGKLFGEHRARFIKLCYLIPAGL